MDRAFRSILDAATTLERLRTLGVGLRSYTELWQDITSPFEALEQSGFAIKEFREMKMQPSLERALRQKKILKA